MKSKKGFGAVIGIILFALFFVAVVTISSYYIETSANPFLNETGFSMADPDVRNEYCFEMYGINYSSNPLEPNELYCTAKLNISTYTHYYENQVNQTNFSSWYINYVDDNKYIDEDAKNEFINYFLFAIIILSMVFSIFVIYQKDVITNVKVIFTGIFGVPITLFIFIVVSRVIDFVIELLDQVFPHLASIDIFAPYPLVQHFYGNIMWYALPYAVLWVLGLVVNKEIVKYSFSGGDEE